MPYSWAAAACSAALSSAMLTNAVFSA